MWLNVGTIEKSHSTDCMIANSEVMKKSIYFAITFYTLSEF